jgi:hypothetical protein
MPCNQEFASLVEPIASRVPYQATAGNHEFDHLSSAWPSAAERAGWAAGQYGDDSGGECGIMYRKRLQMPEGTSSANASVAGGAGRLWYSVDLGPMHLALLTVEQDFTNGSLQHKWPHRTRSSGATCSAS